MAKFAEVTENERIIDRHLRDIHPLLDCDASESQSLYALGLIEIGLSALYSFSVRSRFQYYAAVARSLCDS